MKKIFILVFSIASFNLSAQTEDSLKFSNIHSVQFELIGHGLLYSFNYQLIVINKAKSKIEVISSPRKRGSSFILTSHEALDWSRVSPPLGS